VSGADVEGKDAVGSPRAAAPSRRGVVALAVWAAILLGGAVLALGVTTAEAQEPIRVVGWVQWVSGNNMQMVTDGGGSINIDLTRADQSSYRALRPGELVYVEGTVAPERNRIIARDVWRNAGGGWSQSP
jgi:hypothetical protein